MKQLEENQEIMKKALEEKNVFFLTKWYFNIELSPLQEELVRKVVFEEHKFFNISAMTRWGKSFSLTIAVALYLLLNKNKKVFFISPTKEQSLILRDYLANLIRNCPVLLSIAHMNIQRTESLVAQASRDHQTFTNGNSYRVFTAGEKGDSLMGHGLGKNGGIVIIDEAAQIKSDEVYSKIMRMLGDNPEKSMLIESFNPWTMDCKAFEHSTDPNWYRIRISWKDAVADGRTTKEFIEQMRRENATSPIFFTILYDSKFPTISEFGIFDLEKIKLAQKKEPIKSGTFVISCDVSAGGSDETAIFFGYKQKGGYSVNSIYTEAKSETTAIVGKIMNLIKEHEGEPTQVRIDTIAYGEGVVSMMKEQTRSMKNVRIYACHFGKSPTAEPDKYSNQKAQNYIWLQKVFANGLISIPDNKELTKQLMQMEWQLTSNGKMRIIDPEKLDDLADALVYFTYWVDEGVYGYVAGGGRGVRIR